MVKEYPDWGLANDAGPVCACSKEKSRRAPARKGGQLVWGATRAQRDGGGWLLLEIIHAGEFMPMIVFHIYGKRAIAARVPMPRELDCEMDLIFETAGQYPRGSMHALVYEPVNGELIREVCAGMH
jgi:hypothetical protein